MTRRSSRRSLRAFDPSTLPTLAGEASENISTVMTDIYRDCFILSNPPSQLVMGVQVLKTERSRLRQARGEKLRVLCVIATRGANDDKLRFDVHYVSRSPGSQFSLRRNWSLSDLTSVDVSDELGISLCFDDVDTFHWNAISRDARDEAVWCLLQLASKHCPVRPRTGVDQVELGLHAVEEGFLTKYPLCEDSSLGEDAEHTRTRVSTLHAPGGSLLSDKEAEGIEHLLEGDAWRQLNSQELEAQLQQEADELDRMNEQTLLEWEGWAGSHAESDPPPALQVAAELINLETRITETIQWVGKQRELLDTMASGISQIESENQAQHIQATNHQVLLNILNESVLGTDLDEDSEIVLADLPGALRAAEQESVASTDPDAPPGPNRARVLNAADALHAAITLANDSSRSTYSLAAMEERRNALRRLQEAFDNHVVEFLEDRLERLTGNVEQSSSSSSALSKPANLARRARRSTQPRRSSGGTRNQGEDAAHAISEQLEVPDNRELHALLRQDEGLVRALHEDSLNRFKVSYVSTMKQFYVSRLRDFFAALENLVTRAPRQCRLAALPNAELDGVVGEMARASSEHNSTATLITPNDALEFALSFVIPLVVRERHFLQESFFEGESDSNALDAMVDDMFTKLGKRLDTLVRAEDLPDALHLLTMILTVDTHLENVQELVSSPFLSNLLISAQLTLKTGFNRYIAECEAWAGTQRNDVKRAGVLPPFLKFPAFVDRVELAVHKLDVEIAVASYHKVINAMFSELERAASHNAKYADVVRLENYYFFQHTVGARNVPCLQPHVENARELYEGAVDRYADTSIDYHFGPIARFFANVEARLESMSHSDVRFHIPQAEYDTMQAEARRSALQGVQKLHQRIDKHLCEEAQLLSTVFVAVANKFLTNYERYTELATLCYERTLEPPVAELRALVDRLR